MQRYERLLGWALQVTDHDRARAEDLVHDIFIQFTLSQPAIDRLYNVDGYLYTMLRNMHLSQIRRATRLRDAAPSLANFDSAELGIRNVDPRNQILVREELRLICQYACMRKNSSKAGSVLILRFFHGYYPSEIARILRSTCAAVDQWLRIARREVRLYLNDRESLSFISATTDTAISYPSEASSQTEDVLAQLRKAIFSTNETDCFSREDLRLQFASENPGTVDNQILNHAVTCASCLDEVNRLLRLPLLSERHPTDRLGPDRDSGGGDGPRGPGASSAAAFTRSSRRQLKEVIEHRPHELRIAVNGFVLGSQKVSSEVSELSLSINQAEKLGFIEVFSEQEVRLLFLSIEPPPDGQAEYKEHVELSDGRALELALRFSETWPSLNVTYHDPTFPAESEVLSAESQVGVDSEAITEKSDSQGTARSKVGRSARCREWIVSKFPTLHWGLFLRPGTVTAIFALLLIAVIVIVQLRHAPPLTTFAADLLQRSTTAEAALAARTDQVLHRTISLEAKNLVGEVVARQRIEVWHSGEKRITARRLYDDRGVLIAGDWRRADGVQALYHHGAKPQLQLVPEKRPEALVSADSVWQLDPSAKDFTSLIGNSQNAGVQETPSTYVISYTQQQQEGGGPKLVRATLTLSKSDLHATELTVVLQPKDGAGSMPDTQRSVPVEFRFVESRFERRPIDAVAPALFEPDPDLISSIEPGRNPKPETPVTVAQPPSPVMATAALEVEVLNLLHQVGADLGEQISVTRVADGDLKVQGLVDTDKRKSELLATLSSVSRNPVVKIEISTVAEANAAAEKNARRNPKSVSSEGVVVQRVEAAKDVMPAGPELRRYFGDEEQMRRFASRMINRSHEAMRHAGALKRLLNQFSPQDLRELDPEARAKWLALVRSHANAFQAETAALRQELQPIFFASAPSGASQRSAAITSDEELARAVARLFDLGSANDEIVRAAFSSSASGSGATISSQFWGLLKSTESLAAAIQKAH